MLLRCMPAENPPVRLFAERHAIDRHILRKILRPLFAQILKTDRQLAVHLVINLLQDQHATGFGHRLQPRNEIDAFAQQIIAVDDDVAQVNTDAERQRSVGRLPRTAEFPLHLDGALHGLDHRWKIGDKPVAAVLAMRPLCRSMNLENTSRAARSASSVPTSSASMALL